MLGDRIRRERRKQDKPKNKLVEERLRRERRKQDKPKNKLIV
jgi:hypothetical protein